MSSLYSATTHADSALSYRLSTFGFGIDYDHKLSNTLTMRLGYNLYHMGRSEDSDGLHYDASIRVTSATALLDWHIKQSPWRLTVGLTQGGPYAQANAQATGTVTLNGQTYQADEFGSIKVKVSSTYSPAPYIGIGRGFAVGEADRFAFLFDAGAMYTGSAKASVNAQCSADIATDECEQLLADIKAEAANFEHDWRRVRWWPVIGVGFSMRWH